MRKRVKTIAEAIIRESFPLLEKRRISFLVFYLPYFGFSAWIPPFVRIIVISTRCRNMSDEVLTGILAHELCHQERYLHMGVSRYIRFAAGYIFSKARQKQEERATDMLTIEKGYARQLYQLTMISSADKKHNDMIDNYLSPGEIRDIAIKAGKW